jgi:GTP pyrophosphokinase
MGVAGLVLEAGGDEELAIAALLHDAVEDCGGRPMLVEIERRFGHRVAHIVDGCSDSYGEPKPLWRTRKENYIQRLRGEDEDVRLVSAADKLHNSRSILVDFGEIGESLWQRFRGGREGTLWYYRALLDELKRGRSNRMVRELERVVVEIENRAAAVNVQPLPTRE